MNRSSENWLKARLHDDPTIKAHLHRESKFTIAVYHSVPCQKTLLRALNAYKEGCQADHDDKQLKNECRSMFNHLLQALKAEGHPNPDWAYKTFEGVILRTLDDDLIAALEAQEAATKSANAPWQQAINQHNMSSTLNSLRKLASEQNPAQASDLAIEALEHAARAVEIDSELGARNDGFLSQYLICSHYIGDHETVKTILDAVPKITDLSDRGSFWRLLLLNEPEYAEIPERNPSAASFSPPKTSRQPPGRRFSMLAKPIANAIEILSRIQVPDVKDGSKKIDLNKILVAMCRKKANQWHRPDHWEDLYQTVLLNLSAPYGSSVLIVELEQRNRNRPGYLYVALRNQVLMAARDSDLRWEQKGVIRPTGLADDVDIVMETLVTDPNDDPAKIAARKDTIAFLRDRISNLPKKHRNGLVKSKELNPSSYIPDEERPDFDRYCSETPEGTIRSHAFRAIVELTKVVRILLLLFATAVLAFYAVPRIAESLHTIARLVFLEELDGRAITRVGTHDQVKNANHYVATHDQVKNANHYVATHDQVKNANHYVATHDQVKDANRYVALRGGRAMSMPGTHEQV